jgi:hypothetical protein
LVGIGDDPPPRLHNKKAALAGGLFTVASQPTKRQRE